MAGGSGLLTASIASPWWLSPACCDGRGLTTLLDGGLVVGLELGWVEVASAGGEETLDGGRRKHCKPTSPRKRERLTGGREGAGTPMDAGEAVRRR